MSAMLKTEQVMPLSPPQLAAPHRARAMVDRAVDSWRRHFDHLHYRPDLPVSVAEGLPHLSDFTLQPAWHALVSIEEMYGLLPLLVGSLLVTVGACSLRSLGLVSAIYLGEISPLAAEYSSR